MTTFLKSKRVIGERIICSANVYQDGQQYAHQPTNVESGFVICGLRHNNCIAIFAKIYGFPYSEETQCIHRTEQQGFLTNLNRWVGRQEAYSIAFEADQIIGPNKGIPASERGLDSEDLY